MEGVKDRNKEPYKAARKQDRESHKPTTYSALAMNSKYIRGPPRTMASTILQQSGNTLFHEEIKGCPVSAKDSKERPRMLYKLFISSTALLLVVTLCQK